MTYWKRIANAQSKILWKAEFGKDGAQEMDVLRSQMTRYKLKYQQLLRTVQKDAEFSDMQVSDDDHTEEVYIERQRPSIAMALNTVVQPCHGAVK